MIDKRIISSKMAIAGMLILAGFLGWQEFQQFSSQKKIEIQKKNLQEQADALTKKSDDLKTSLQYLNSTDFKERVARQQLNLKKEGESVYSFVNVQNTASTSGVTPAASQSNFTKWWRYFFVN